MNFLRITCHVLQKNIIEILRGDGILNQGFLVFHMGDENIEADFFHNTLVALSYYVYMIFFFIFSRIVDERTKKGDLGNNS